MSSSCITIHHFLYVTLLGKSCTCRRVSEIECEHIPLVLLGSIYIYICMLVFALMDFGISYCPAFLYNKNARVKNQKCMSAMQCLNLCASIYVLIQGQLMHTRTGFSTLVIYFRPIYLECKTSNLCLEFCKMRHNLLIWQF